MVSKKPTLRGYSRRQAAAQPDGLRLAHLLACSRELAASSPYLAAELGAKSMRLADETGIPMPKGAMTHMCRKCGGSLETKHVEQVVVVPLSKAYRRRQSERIHKSKSGLNRPWNTHALVRTCPCCQSTDVRPFQSADMALDVARKLGLVVKCAETREDEDVPAPSSSLPPPSPPPSPPPPSYFQSFKQKHQLNKKKKKKQHDNLGPRNRRLKPSRHAKPSRGRRVSFSNEPNIITFESPADDVASEFKRTQRVQVLRRFGLMRVAKWRKVTRRGWFIKWTFAPLPSVLRRLMARGLQNSGGQKKHLRFDHDDDDL